MCQESLELEKFAKESWLKQKRIEDWKEEKERGFRELEQGTVVAEQQSESGKVASDIDMPEQKADEKEFWQKRRQRIQLHKMVKKANRLNREDRPEINTSSIISENELTPRNVLEHFDEIKYRLDYYPDKSGELYKKSREAFETSLKVLGYSCITKEDGKVEIERIWSNDKKEALKKNRETRDGLKTEIKGHMDRCNEMAEGLYQEMLVDSKDTLATQIKLIKEKKEKWRDLGDFMRNYPPVKAYHDLNQMEDQHGISLAIIPEEKREIVNKIYEEYQRLGKVRTNYYEMKVALVSCINQADKKWNKPYKESIIDIYKQRLTDCEAKRSTLDSRSDILLSIIKKVVFGKEYTPEEEIVFSELVPVHENKEEGMRKAEEKSTCYAGIYAKKEALLKEEMAKAGMQVNEKLGDSGGNRFMMLMKENDDVHNRTVVQALKIYMELGKDRALKSKEMGRLVKPILQPLFEKIRNYDVETLLNISDKKLEERLEELQELGMINQQLGDLGKIIDPDDPQGRSIKDNLCGDKKMYNHVQMIISEAALKGRCNAMIKAYKLGCLDERSFTQKELSDHFNYPENQVIERTELLKYIQKRMEVAANMNKANVKGHPEYEVRKKVLPRLERLKEFSTIDFGDCDDEVLLAHYQELKDIHESIEQVNVSVEKYSLGRDVYNGDKKLWELKRDVMEFYYDRARLLTLKKADEEGKLSPGSFTEAERKEIREKNGLESDTAISREHMKTYINETLEEQKGKRDKIYKVYLPDSADPYADYSGAIKPSVAEKWIPKVYHEDFNQEMEEVKQEVFSEETGKKLREEAEKSIREEIKEAFSNEAKEASSEQSIKNKIGSIEFLLTQNEEKEYIEYAKLLKADLAKIQESIKDLEQKNEDASQIKEQKEKEQQIKRKLGYVNIIIGLKQRDYMMADQSPSEKKLLENFTRYTKNGFTTLPAFADLSSDEFFTMFAKMYAGCIEREQATFEEIEAYREENVQGLLSYKQCLIKHTEYLESVFNYKLPSLEYAREHYKELENINALSQLHFHMATRAREMFDLTNPDDQKLFYKIHVLSEIGHSTNAMMMGGTDSIGYACKAVKERADEREKFLNFEDNRKKEIIQEEQQYNDKFRKLAQEATDILRRGNMMQKEEQKKLYDDFIARAQELENYVKENESIKDLKSGMYDYSPEVFRMEQIRAWNHQVQKKRAILENRLEE